MTQADRQSRTGASPADIKLDRPIGLCGGIALVIGGVIGMGIYALIAAVGAQAGSTLWVAFFIAMIVSAIGVAPLIQIASALEFDLSFAFSAPQGAGGLIMASILCYSVCMGFQVIAEMGEEMVNARRNIPLALLIGGTVVLVIYIIVGTVFISAIPYDFEKIKAMTAPLMETGRMFLPDFWVIFLSIGALSAGLTSFNAGAIALPRELFSQARDGVMPELLGKIHPRTRSPLNAVIAYFVFTVFLILLGQHIDFYGVATAVGILLMTAVIAVAAVRLPAKFPERYEQAYFKISKFWLIVFAAVTVISSLGFVFIVLMELPVVGIIYMGWVALVVGYYFLRVGWLKKTGVDWDTRIRRLPGYDEEEKPNR